MVEDAGWLDDHGLVELTQTDGITSARITRSGLDIALGRVTQPGVRRPNPD
ncbi:hypothetical protein CCP3SC1_2320001 [Gammaproteobacteria bacterium]